MTSNANFERFKKHQTARVVTQGSNGETRPPKPNRNFGQEKLTNVKNIVAYATRCENKENTFARPDPLIKQADKVFQNFMMK